jgi:hypothetical protein
MVEFVALMALRPGKFEANLEYHILYMVFFLYLFREGELILMSFK